MSQNADYVVPSLVLIARDADVLLPARTLTTLISYALAGPCTEASRKSRDTAVNEAHAAVIRSYEATLREAGPSVRWTGVC